MDCQNPLVTVVYKGLYRNDKRVVYPYGLLNSTYKPL